MQRVTTKMNTARIMWYTRSTGIGFGEKDDGKNVLLLKKNIMDIDKFEWKWRVNKKIQYRIEKPQVNIALDISFVKHKKEEKTVTKKQPPADTPVKVPLDEDTDEDVAVPKSPTRSAADTPGGEGMYTPPRPKTEIENPDRTPGRTPRKKKEKITPVPFSLPTHK